MEISENAIVGDIELADGVQIDGAVVASGCRLDRGVRLEQGAIIGPNCHLGPDVWIGRRTILDENNMLFKGEVSIYAKCFIGKQNVFHGTKISVGAETFIGEQNYIDREVKICRSTIMRDNNILLIGSEVQEKGYVPNRNMINAHFSVRDFSNPRDNKIVIDDQRELELNDDVALPKLDIPSRVVDKSSSARAPGKKSVQNLSPAKN